MNNFTSYLAVFVGGGLGSALRYFIANAMAGSFSKFFPWATVISNLIASFFLAIFMFYIAPGYLKNDTWRLLFAVGFCGGFSTFSSFSFESFELIKSGHLSIAILNILISVIFCIALIWLVYISLKSN